MSEHKLLLIIMQQLLGNFQHFNLNLPTPLVMTIWEVDMSLQIFAGYLDGPTPGLS